MDGVPAIAKKDAREGVLFRAATTGAVQIRFATRCEARAPRDLVAA